MNDTEMDQQIANAMSHRTNGNADAEVARAARELRVEITETRHSNTAKKRYFLGAASATVAAGVAVITLATSTPPTSSPSTTVAEGNGALTLLRAAATSAAARQQQDGNYWHVKTIVDSDGGREPQSVDIWLGNGRPGKVLAGINGKAEEKAIPAEAIRVVIGVREYTWDEIRNLPKDPQALMELLRTQARVVETAEVPLKPDAASKKFTEDQMVLIFTTELLTMAPITPETARALFEVLTLVPGVREDGQQQDGVGRTGTALTWNLDDSYVQTLILDARSGKLLANRGSWSEDGRSGTHMTTYVESGFVDVIQ
jgi:hypothetical protein